MKHIIRFISVLFFLVTLFQTHALSSASCNNDVFVENSCSLCFYETISATTQEISDGDVAIVSTKYNWENTTEDDMVLVQEEQKYPEFLVLGNSWQVTPGAMETLWSYGEDISWEETDGQNEYLLFPEENIDVFVSNENLTYTFFDKDAEDGSMIGLGKHELVYRNLDENFDLTDSKTATQCIGYVLEKNDPEEAVIIEEIPKAPVEIIEPKVIEKKEPSNVIESNMTKVTTGPEHILLILVALTLGYVYVQARKKSSLKTKIKTIY